jgi:acid phosphatase
MESPRSQSSVARRRRRSAESALIILLGAGAFVGAAGQSRPRTLLAHEKVQNLGRLKEQLRAYQACTCTCGCYEADLARQVAEASRFVNRRSRQSADEKLAIVLDVDETSLSNYAYFAANDFGYDAARFDAWVETAKAPAVEPTLRLVQLAQERRVAIFFISGRPERQRDATIRNLRSAGFEGWSGLYLRDPVPGQGTVAQFKAAMRERVKENGYAIVLNVGDQLSDLAGTPAAELSIELPNPFYFIP